MRTQDNDRELTFLDSLRVVTPQLRSMVDLHQGALPKDQFQALIADIKKVYEKYSAHLSGYHPGAERARAGHRLINASMVNSSNFNSSCAKGCGSCCHLEVEITQDEGELLAKIVEAGFEIDRDRLARQAARERKSPEWSTMGTENNRCVFLGPDQDCQIYESRPSICRKVLVASAPSECRKYDGNPLPILIPLAEIALTAALNQPGNLASSLSKSLTTALLGEQTRLLKDFDSGIEYYPEGIIGKAEPETAVP